MTKGAGAPEEFTELFDHEFERPVRCLRALDDDAADAVQEAFVQAFLRWRHVSTLEDPAGWVRRVAINRLLNVKRSRRRRDAARARLPEPAVPLEPDDRVDLRDAVRRLPAQQRIAIALFYGGDLSVREVATALDVSEGTVKSHLHDGRARLRGLLETVDE